MSRTYRNYEDNAYKCYRRPRGHVQAVLNDVRQRAVPPDAWDDYCFQREQRVPWKVTRKMLAAGENITEIIHRLKTKFKMPFSLAEKIAVESKNWHDRNEEAKRHRKEMKDGERSDSQTSS